MNLEVGKTYTCRDVYSPQGYLSFTIKGFKVINGVVYVVTTKDDLFTGVMLSDLVENKPCSLTFDETVDEDDYYTTGCTRPLVLDRGEKTPDECPFCKGAFNEQPASV